MKPNFEKISPIEMPENVFKMVGKDWMLITAGSSDSYNTMTASWGMFGDLWSKSVCMCFIRPLRYTNEFMERGNSFSLSFFGENYHDALKFCGENSGRDVNKSKITGLTPFEIEDGITSFEQAKLIITCNKIYRQDLIRENYTVLNVENPICESDPHIMYIGEIRNCYVRKKI